MADFECEVPGCDQGAQYFVAYEQMINIGPDLDAYFAVCDEHSYYQQQDAYAEPLKVPLAAFGR